MDLVRPVIACLVAVYAALWGRGVCADIEPLLMIRPPRGVCVFIIRTAWWAHRKAPVRLVSTACRQPAGEISSTGPAGPNIPALLTSRSTRCHRCWTAPNSAATDSGTVTSVGTARPAPDAAAAEDRVSRSGCSRRPAAATRHPAASRAWAMHRPRPDPAPVTTATPVVAVIVRLPFGSPATHRNTLLYHPHTIPRRYPRAPADGGHPPSSRGQGTAKRPSWLYPRFRPPRGRINAATTYCRTHRSVPLQEKRAIPPA